MKIHSKEDNDGRHAPDDEGGKKARQYGSKIDIEK
jgi:hypothetical protein